MKKNRILRSSFLAAMCIAGAGAHAQSSISVSSEEFIDAPVLPFAPPPPSTLSQTAPVLSVVVGSPVAPFIAAPTPSPASVASFAVLSTDRTIREVLQRWARSAGWTHDQVHWTLLRDFPIQGTASADNFKGDFKAAVRTLLSSTESTDLPAQPCFYSNRIVRVVSQAEICDRSTAITQ